MAELIYTKRPLKRKFLGLHNERPKAEPGQAVVLLGRDAPIVLYPGQSVSPGESVWGTFETVYEVDTTLKEIAFEASAPAKGGVWEFQVRFSASYQVSDPLEVINRGIQNPIPLLERVIKDLIGQVTQDFDIEDGEAARRSVRDRLNQGLGSDIPFRISAVHIALEPDREAKEYLREKRRQQRKAALISGKRQVIEAQDLIDKLQLKMKREGETEMVQHYGDILDKGITGILAQQLAHNPENAPQITNFLLQLHQQDVQGKVQILQTMLDKDMIEDWQLQEVVESIVKTSTAGPFPSAPQLGGSASQKRLPGSGSEKADENEKVEDEAE